MAVKDTFLSLEKLAQEVHEKIKALKNGQLKLDQLNDLLADVQEIHERTIILRYRAMLDEVSPSKPGTTSSSAFRLDKEGISENQTSLIDAIEELGQEEAQAILDKVEERAHPEDVVAEPQLELEKPQEEAQPIPEVRPLFVPQPDAVEEVAEKTEALQEDNQQVDSQSLSEESLPELPSEDEGSQAEVPATVGEKLTKSAIDSIKSSIGLNQKFRFINELFDGDAERYASVIEELDSAASGEQALTLFTDLKRKRNWDEEEEITILLLNLVERRYA